MKNFAREIRHAFRALRQRPAFTAAALISLALGIGANTTIFTMVHAAFLQPMPVEDPDRVVSVLVEEKNHTGTVPASFPNFRDLRDQNDVLQGMAAAQWFRPNWSDGEQPVRIFGQVVTENFFSLLGVKPHLGRVFTADDLHGGDKGNVAVVTYDFWSRHSGQASFVGSKMILNGRPFVVIGVAPRGFKGANIFNQPDLWVPMSVYRQVLPFGDYLEDRSWGLFEMIGRLKPGVSVAQARTSLQGIARRLEEAYPESNKNQTLNVLPMAEAAIDAQQRQVYTRAAVILMSIVSLLLLIACSNVSSLLLTRGVARRKEIAVRLALGAGRPQLVRQLLTESLVLSLLGGALGVAFALWAPRLLWRFRPPFFTENALDLGLNLRVLAYTFLVSILAGVLFGLAPALQTFKADLVSVLREQEDGSAGHRRFPVRNVLIVAQVALSLLALLGAGLFLRSLHNAHQIHPGFNTANVLTMNFSLSGEEYGEERGREFYRQVVEAAEALPGARMATLASNRPLQRGALFRRAVPEGQELSDEDEIPPIRTDTVGLKYFETLEIPIVEGRGFNADDRPGKPLVAVVNQTLARRFWGQLSPIGRRILVPEDDLELEVVGVAADAKYQGLGEPPTPLFYLSLNQVYMPEVNLYVRAEGAVAPLREPLRRAVQAVDRTLPISNYQSLEDAIDISLWGPRMGAMLLSVFAVLALVLAATGIYGVVAYSVSQRNREVGIRMALGARRQDVLGMILSQTMKIVGIGLTLGLLAAYAGGRVFSGMLYGIGATDLRTFVEIVLILALVALLASFLAARRGTRVSPSIALRNQ